MFQAAKNATIMATLTLEKTEEESGIIYATRVIRGGQGHQGRFFYKNLVEETGPEITDVTIMTKSQASCIYKGPAWYLFLVLGIVTILLIPLEISSDNYCLEGSVPHWNGSSLPEMNNVLNFTRSNLLAAGVL